LGQAHDHRSGRGASVALGHRNVADADRWQAIEKAAGFEDFDD
jgi:hypothetical protein